MEPNTTNTAQAQHDEISLKELILKIRELIRYLVTKWKIIILAGIVGGALGFLYAWSKKPVYAASCTFVLDEGKSGGGLSQYAGLAAMAGINIGGGASDGLFQGDNIMELYKSRRMLEATLLSYGEFDGEKDLLINRYIKINNLHEAWGEDPKLSGLSFSNQHVSNRIKDSVLASVVADIRKNYLTVEKLDKNLTILDVRATSLDEQFSLNLAVQAVSTVNNFFVETKTKKANESLELLQYQADSVRNELNKAISNTASAIDANPNANPALSIVQVPSQKRQIDVQANSAIYSEVVKNRELARMSLHQETPLIQIVDVPKYPLAVSRSSKVKFTIVGAVSFIFLISIWFFAILLVRKIMR